MSFAGRQTVLSGIRATGRLHLGNYLGVLERFARLSQQSDKRCLFFIADLHTLTTLKDAALIRQHAPNIVLDMLAAGVDPERATIYAQSDVPIVTSLAWFLACLTPAGDLERMPTYKDKAARNPADDNGGLLFYPVLMAADILGPRANLVPVGEDQRPHLELARQLARRFNRLYGKFFPVPDAMEADMVSVPGLVAMDAEGRVAKMGKSEAPEQTVYLTDSPAEAGTKIVRAPTDPARARRTDCGTPSKCAIFQLHSLVSTGEELRWSADGCTTASISCVECKEALVRNIDARLSEFRRRREALDANPKRVEEILTEGGKLARALFKETTAFVADRMGVFSRNR